MTDWHDIIGSISRLWQQLLRLDDWDLDIKIVRAWKEPQAYAVIRADGIEKHATMSFVDPRDWNPEELSGDAVENTVVHEQLHLFFREAGYEYDEEKEERVVHRLARVLCALRRNA